jgi:predicted RND superfamily exporter protein
MIVVLWIVFQEIRFVLLPILIAFLSILTTCGLLGTFGWQVTVISSNFVSLQIIITMSIIIHLIVRYRELMNLYPKASHKKVILDTVLSMAKPSFFAVITTIAGFSSLVVSDILPVINLGWMMSAGIALSLLIAFLVFPTVMILLPKHTPHTAFERKFTLIQIYADFAQNYGKTIFFVSFIVIIFSITGGLRLMVENSFIDYFKTSTPIYQGMKIIDQKLGGTTPLDLIYDFDMETIVEEKIEVADDDFDDFEEEFSQTKDEAKYWFTPGKMRKVQKIHNYLKSLPEVGNVQSLSTMLEVGKVLNSGKELDNFELALLYNELPEKFKNSLFNPYVSIKDNEVRFAMRIIDSDKNLRRNEFIEKIKHDVGEMQSIKSENVHLSNLMILYNNMLQSLFNSQIKTLGIMISALTLMFFFLFKSVRLAFIAMVANIIPIATVFGLMGWANIPLDMMTITIAAISIGMGVDNTIHYIHRFSIEIEKDGDYHSALQRSHGSIGYAMYYTTFSIMIGFSVLVLSNFLPTIYFGLLTVFAIFMALTADLLLLPRLILFLKPFRR